VDKSDTVSGSLPYQPLYFIICRALIKASIQRHSFNRVQALCPGYAVPGHDSLSRTVWFYFESGVV